MSTPWWRQARRWLAGRNRGQPGALAGQARAFAEAQTLVRAYYAALLYLAFVWVPAWAELATGPSELGLLWPVAWMQATGTATGGKLVVMLFLGGALAAAVAPGSRFCRALAALGLLEHTAFTYSDGKIGHSTHVWVLTSLILVFLPRLGAAPRRRERQDYLNVFWAAHALLLLTYTMSGLGKVAGAAYQALRGEVTAFHPQALALHIADRLTETGAQSPVGRWLVDHTWLGWPLMLGAIYLQTFAFWTIFRPSLLRVWTIGLIVFHVATYFVLTIRFGPPILLLAMWGLASPFAQKRPDFRSILNDLPLLGICWRKLFLRVK